MWQDGYKPAPQLTNKEHKNMTQQHAIILASIQCKLSAQEARDIVGNDVYTSLYTDCQALNNHYVVISTGLSYAIVKRSFTGDQWKRRVR